MTLAFATPAFLPRWGHATSFKETAMLTTIRLAGEITAQGLRVADHTDGRVEYIDRPFPFAAREFQQ